jgi:hypothetical protein
MKKYFLQIYAPVFLHYSFYERLGGAGRRTAAGKKQT